MKNKILWIYKVKKIIKLNLIATTLAKSNKIIDFIKDKSYTKQSYRYIILHFKPCLCCVYKNN